MVTVEVRATGRRRGLVPAFPLPVDPSDGAGPLTLRQLIVFAVGIELAAANERRAERALPQILAEPVGAETVAAGTVGALRPGGRRSPQLPSPDDAAAVALQAFADGLFLVLVDGRQEEDLDALVALRLDSTVTFVRLVALAGG